MAIARKGGTLIRVEAMGNAGSTDLENRMVAYYSYQVTGLGRLQNKAEKSANVGFTTLAADTRVQIMTKAKAAVDAEILAG